MAAPDKLFGRPDSAVLRGLSIRLDPPATVRAAFIARHAQLLSGC
jgi:hypothetical protein